MIEILLWMILISVTGLIVFFFGGTAFLIIKALIEETNDCINKRGNKR